MTPILKSPLARTVAGTLRLAALSVALIAAPACAWDESGNAQSPPEGVSEKLSIAYEKLERRGFNGVVAIAYEGNEPIVKGFGETASAAGIPSGTTLVDTGSITKTITAAAALRLIDEGKLATSDRVSKYFPDAPADKAGITVHQLLTHSAGLPDAVASDEETINRATFIERALSADLLFEPGSSYSYSNVGYSVVAAIIEDISGQPYEVFVRESLLAKHNLKSIGYAMVFDPERSLLTRDGKNIREFSWGGDDAYWALIGNGGLTATANEMIEFRRLFASGTLVSSAAINLAQTPMVLEGEGAQSHYGYGMVVEDHPAFGRIYWHNGGNLEFMANWTDYADRGVVVFTASNTPDFDADLAGLTIAEALFDVKIFPDDYDKKREQN